jgi:putative component of membrane protein insertase Oxa1/YidC/SpoIIIJ protein YidD
VQQEIAEIGNLNTNFFPTCSTYEKQILPLHEFPAESFVVFRNENNKKRK